MNYLDVYYSRINHLGETTAERIRNGGIRSFEKWMAESPHTIRGLSVERGLYFDGIILTSKDKEYEKIMFLNVSNEIPLKVGDIMNWILDDGSMEKWLLIQEEKKVNGTYRSFWIVRCNYLMKWIDSQGHLQQSWSYFVSSLSDKIKGNFRTWHSLITPQPNKYAELLLPKYPIERATNFIVEEESWSVIEYDHTSVPGVMYISLTENKINSIYDEVNDNLADIDKLAKYSLEVPPVNQIFAVNEKIEPIFTIMKNDKPYKAEVEFIPVNKKVAKLINGELFGINNGTTDIIIRLRDYPEIEQVLSITVGSEEQEFSAYIEGPTKVRLDGIAVYYLKGTKELEGKVSYIINDTSLASIDKIENNTCTVHINDKNILNTFILTAIYKDQEYTKEITIIPLW